MDWFELDITKSPNDLIDIKVDKMKIKDGLKNPVVNICHLCCYGYSRMWINKTNIAEKQERQQEILDKIADLVIELEKEL